MGSASQIFDDKINLRKKNSFDGGPGKIDFFDDAQRREEAPRGAKRHQNCVQSGSKARQGHVNGARGSGMGSKMEVKWFQNEAGDGDLMNLVS